MAPGIKQAFIQWIFITTCRLWSSHSVPATKKRSEIPLFPSPSTCRHQDVTGPWKPVTVKPRGCHTNIPDVMTFDVPFWSVPRIAFLGETPLAALSPEHSDTKALWFLVHVRPFTGEPNHKGLGYPIPGLQSLGRNGTSETDCCPPCFKMSKVTYGGAAGLYRGSSPMNCNIVSHTLWLIFTFPSQLCLWQQCILCVQDSNMQ